MTLYCPLLWFSFKFKSSEKVSPFSLSLTFNCQHFLKAPTYSKYFSMIRQFFPLKNQFGIFWNPSKVLKKTLSQGSENYQKLNFQRLLTSSISNWHKNLSFDDLKNCWWKLVDCTLLLLQLNIIIFIEKIWIYSQNLLKKSSVLVSFLNVKVTFPCESNKIIPH